MTEILEIISKRLSQENLGGPVKEFRDLLARLNDLQDSQRQAFEHIMKDAAADIYASRRVYNGSSWREDNAYQMCCLAHIASVYDKQHDCYDSTGLTYSICDQRVAKPPNFPLQDLNFQGFNLHSYLPEYLLRYPDEMKLINCVNLMLAISGIKELDYVFAPKDYVKLLNTLDGLAQIECLSPYVTERLYAFGIMCAEKEGKLEDIKDRLNNCAQHTHRAIAEEILLPPGGILLGLVDLENAVHYKICKSNQYALYPQVYSWAGWNLRLNGFLHALDETTEERNFKAMDDLFRFSSDKEQQALYSGFMRLFAKAGRTPESAGFFAVEQHARALSEYWKIKQAHTACERPVAGTPLVVLRMAEFR